MIEEGENRWSKEDVMDYFGEWIRSEKECDKIMEAVELRVSGTFSAKMSEVRRILIEVLGEDVRFMSGYRRVKK